MASETANRAALHRAFDEHYEAISRYCHRRLPAVDANDAAAEVFVVAWRRIEDMPTADGTLPWLYGVARNQVSTSRRSARRRSNLITKLNGQAHHPEPGPEAAIVRNSEQQELLKAMVTLRPADQEILRLRTYEHLSVSEIAVVLDCSVEAAKKRSARALHRLRRAAGIAEAQSSMTGPTARSEGGDA